MSAKEENPFEKMNGATEKTREFVEKAYLTALQSAAQYNAKLLEFARVKNEAAFHYANELSGMKTPAEFLEITARHAREQLAVMTAQAKELATLGQQATLKAAEPFKGGGAKGFG
ncbi:MAG TPA: phasin family protein [Xanthobacteraceae bacterium]|nr:phasin family protein [Xanthobacteraceae bacterium]